MTIRPATRRDVPLVLPMVNSIGRMHESLDPAKYGFCGEPARLYERWLSGRADDPRSVFLVACAGGGGGGGGEVGVGDAKVIGFLVGTIEQEIPIYRVREYGFLHDVWIDPPYRNEGVGRQMVSLAVERFAAMGVSQVRCDTAHANDMARRLFEACGFRPSTVEMLLEIPPASPATE
jgi:ribosomal protein S18 acetylase RimI-like enzyme